MSAPPLSAESAAGTVADCSSVLACDRVAVGASRLLRVHVALGGLEPGVACAARLLVAEGTTYHRLRSLPAPAAVDGGRLTLGFAMSTTAVALGIVLDGRTLALPEPRVVALGAEAVPQRPAADTRSHALLREAEERLVATQARLDDALATITRLRRGRRSARSDRPTRGSRQAVGVLVACAWVALVGTALIWSARDGGADQGLTGVASASPSRGNLPALAQRLQIPAGYLELYQRAGAQYGLDWTRLAAIGAIESAHGQTAAPGVLTGSNAHGASGPAQFLAATWERFGLDGDADGRRNPYAPADAILGMASYLRASGAPQDWGRALRTYNHSDAYAVAVEQLAARYRARVG